MVKMLIDVHTHFFPDSIAESTVKKISSVTGIPPVGDGTLSSLLEYMQKEGVSWSVNQPVATKVEQVHSINRRMVELNQQGLPLLCFGSMHPDFTNPEEEIAFLKGNEVRGIKLHPDYQNFYPDDHKMSRIYESCLKHNLIILFHSGVEPAYPDVRSAPQRFDEVLKIKGLKIILAHLGGYRMWDEFEKYLLGRDVYLETSFCGEVSDAQLKNIIINHGPERVFFGTDFPWAGAAVVKKKIEELNLDRTVKEKIFFKNAQKLLDII